MNRAPEHYDNWQRELFENLPNEWKLAKAQFLVQRQVRDVLETDDVVTVFRDGEVTLRTNRRTDGFTFADKEIGYHHVEPGDLAIHKMDGGFGAIGISDSAGKVSPVVNLYRSDNFDLRFVSYFLRTAVAAGYVKSLQKGIRERSIEFDHAQFSDFYLPLPPLETQRRIADYLDKETSEIDTLVKELDEYVELLEKRKRVAVYEMVSYDDDGSSYPLAPLKLLFKRFGSGTTPKGDHFYVSGEVPWVTTSELRETDISETKKNVTQEAVDSISGLRIHESGTILIAMYGATIGRFGRLTVPAACNQACCALSEPDGADEDFVYAALFAYRDDLVQLAVGGGQPNINQDTVKNFAIPLPPPDQQEAIAKRVTEELTQTDTIITQCRELKELLLKRRQVLITDVVTGKVEV